MQINKLSQINFGMPKISERARSLVAPNSVEGKKILEEVERLHPEAYLDVYYGYPESGKKGVLHKAVRAVDKITGNAPNYYITVNEYKVGVPNDESIAVDSVNGKVSVSATEKGKSFMHVQSTTKKYGKLTPSDLLHASNKFSKHYDEALDIAKNWKPKK